MAPKKPAPEPLPTQTLKQVLKLADRQSLVVSPKLDGKLRRPNAAPTPPRSSFFGGGQPPAPDPSVVTGPTLVTATPEGRRVPRSTKAPPPPSTLSGNVSYDAPRPASFNAAVVTFHVRALITVFEEVEGYDPRLHHNRNPPALWSSDPDIREDLKALLKELRRLNDLLEAGKEPPPSAKQRLGSALTAGAATVFKATCNTIGVGLGLVILGTFAEILSQLGFRRELDEILSWSPKLK